MKRDIIWKNKGRVSNRAFESDIQYKSICLPGWSNSIGMIGIKPIIGQEDGILLVSIEIFMFYN